MELNYDIAKPIYQQIIDEIKKSVIRGELTPGSQIPSQRELAVSAHVNPNTVQRAYREMENMKLVETLRGQGTFICQREGMIEELRSEMAMEILENFLNEMRSLGQTDESIMEMLQKHIQQKVGR